MNNEWEVMLQGDGGAAPIRLPQSEGEAMLGLSARKALHWTILGQL